MGQKIIEMQLLQSICQKYNIDITKSISELSENQKKSYFMEIFKSILLNLNAEKRKIAKKR